MKTYSDLIEDFSTSYSDGKNFDRAEKLIDEYLNTKGMIKDGNMVNLSTLPILLSNVLDIYSEARLAFHISFLNDKEYIIKISIL